MANPAIDRKVLVAASVVGRAGGPPR
jgi:hypothetical protein